MSLEERDTETEKINVRVPIALLEEIDDVWEKRGYASKSEFIRDALRDAVHPSVTISEETLDDLAVSREQRERGETIPLEDAVENFDADAE
jgi:Arc/MetJ-type ribon-helix-helix transcriptional regulator